MPQILLRGVGEQDVLPGAGYTLALRVVLLCLTCAAGNYNALAQYADEGACPQCTAPLAFRLATDRVWFRLFLRPLVCSGVYLSYLPGGTRVANASAVPVGMCNAAGAVSCNALVCRMSCNSCYGLSQSRLRWLLFRVFHLMRDVLQTRGFNYRCEAWKVGAVANTTGDGADMFRLFLLCDATVD
jgi:hypothetical protein